LAAVDFPNGPGWRRACLVAAGPVVLLWSQIGTVVWVGVLFLLGLWEGFRGTTAQRRTIWRAVVMAGALLLPLGAWWVSSAAGLGPTPTIPLSRLPAAVFGPIGESIGLAWVSRPGRWAGSPAWAWMGLAVLVFAGVAARRRGSRLDLLIALGIGLWAASWVALLALGRAPPHAVTAKHLLPLVLGSLSLVVRSTAAGGGRRLRRCAFAVLAVSLASHSIGLGQLVGAPSSTPLLAALRSADALLANSPQRGYLLPLVAAMRPGAGVMIASPGAAAERWDEVQAVLPEAGLLVAEIDTARAGEGFERLFGRLEARWGPPERLRGEPKRIVTRFGNWD
jgi:hypothetical protein